jgi:hypothetical protein
MVRTTPREGSERRLFHWPQRWWAVVCSVRPTNGFLKTPPWSTGPAWSQARPVWMSGVAKGGSSTAWPNVSGLRVAPWASTPPATTLRWQRRASSLLSAPAQTHVSSTKPLHPGIARLGARRYSQKRTGLLFWATAHLVGAQLAPCSGRRVCICQGNCRLREKTTHNRQIWSPSDGPLVGPSVGVG